MDTYAEIADVGDDVLLFVGFGSFLYDFLDPRVVEGLLGGGALVGVLF
jgi:hypothetical protein